MLLLVNPTKCSCYRPGSQTKFTFGEYVNVI